MFNLFKKTVSASSIGEAFADAVSAVHTQLKPDLSASGVSTETIAKELLYLQTFVFERVVNRLFSERDIQERMLTAYAQRLILKHLNMSAENFQVEYDKRSATFGVAWCDPPDYKTATNVAGEICRLLGSFHYDLLAFLSTQVPRTYATAWELLSKAKQEKTIS